MVLGGILLRVRPAGLYLVVIVQHRPRRWLVIFRHDVDYEAALPGMLPDVRLGWIGFAQFGFLAKQRVRHGNGSENTGLNAAEGVGFQPDWDAGLTGRCKVSHVAGGLWPSP